LGSFCSLRPSPTRAVAPLARHSRPFILLHEGSGGACHNHF
jgi:hypothetical protein